ncbi:hypothetical protein RIF29_18266 [Crotalaria pallida]|uniref:Cation/H+ exchanger domain-containing protein n=1 Tax=Crotalaria pallida TaxID=3830 RepID=A0AAN9FKY8_CROPI
MSNLNWTLYNSIKKFNGTMDTVCFDSPPKTISDGFWIGSISGRSPMKSFLPMFELQVLAIFVVNEICSFILKPLGFPLFVSQMVAGLLLNTLAKGRVAGMIMLFPIGTHDVISSISSLGYVFYIFLNGVQMDFSLIKRTGKGPWAIAIVGLLTPIIIGHLLLFKLPQSMDTGFGSGYKDIYIAITSCSETMFAVIATLLNELQIQNSELGRLALSTSLVMEILSTIITSIIVVVVTLTTSFVEAFVHFALLFSEAILIPLVCRPGMFWIIKHTPEGRPVKSVYLHLIVILVFILGWCSVKIGQDFVLGAFILGLSVPEGPPLGSALVKKFQFLGHWFLLPIFVTTSTMKVELLAKPPVIRKYVILIISCIVVFTHLVKIVSCFIPALYYKMPMKDALALSLIMNCKGVVEIGLYSNLHDAKIISPEAYKVLVISVMIVASIGKLSMKFLYDSSKKYATYQRRNIMNLKPHSQLKIVACIHKPYHISPIMNTLDLCCPTLESPIIVDALHLMELIGSSLPLFIPHGLYRKNTIGYKKSSYSDNFIIAFDMYEHDNAGAAKIHTHTAISPSKLMYEDVCHLALDKAASIIFLPFHQRWTSDGSVESNDKNLRTLNNKALEISPCSIGILVTRVGFKLIRESSITRLAMIFLGGKDDREGLCLAKRAIRNPNIELVVYHLVTEGRDCNQEENLHDKAVLRDIDKGMRNVAYQKIILNEGPQIALFLRDIVNEHDYFIVGRRHKINSPQTQGLSEWSEFPELGVIGDFLASPDFKTRASILVVQQQVSKK